MPEATQPERVNLGVPQSVAPESAGYQPPTDAVPLPSQGKVYPIGHPLAGKDLVEIRSMTARDEDILTSKALLKQGKAIAVLLKSCIVDRSIDPDSLLVGDKNAILIAVRVTGYGKEYQADVVCPSCEQKSKFEFDLSQLPIRRLGVEPIAPGVNAFSFLLPKMKQTVLFKLLTGHDEAAASLLLERTRKANGPLAVEPTITTQLAAQVIQIGEQKDPIILSKVLQGLSAYDSRKLRTYMDKIQPGVQMIQQFKCARCEEEAEVTVPLGTEFFWPS